MWARILSALLCTVAIAADGVFAGVYWFLGGDLQAEWRDAE